MPGFRVWDIVRVPFPCTNRPIAQRRPALVVGQHRGPGSPHPDPAGAGLPAPSMVRCAKIATVETGDIEPIGRLGHEQQRAVRGHVLLGLHKLISETLEDAGP